MVGRRESGHIKIPARWNLFVKDEGLLTLPTLTLTKRCANRAIKCTITKAILQSALKFVGEAINLMELIIEASRLVVSVKGYVMSAGATRKSNYVSLSFVGERMQIK